MSNKDRYDLQLKAVVDALSRSTIDATDEEIEEDARLAGVDLDADAARLKQMLTGTAKTFHKRKFFEAQAEYEKEARILQRGSFQLPGAIAEQRALLHLVAAQQAQRGAPLTAHGRDLESLTDKDVTSLLEELAALGLLPEAGSDKG
jgi:hypothetical protein